MSGRLDIEPKFASMAEAVPDTAEPMAVAVSNEAEESCMIDADALSAIQPIMLFRSLRPRTCAWMVTAACLYCCACTRAARARAADWMVTVAHVVMYR